MNTNTDLKIRLGNSLLKHVVSNYQSSTLEFILAQHIMDMEQGKTTEQDPCNCPGLAEQYSSLMQDFQGKCDELTTTQVEMSDLRNAYCKLQEQFNAVERAIKGMRGDYDELKNSKAALLRDYGQLLEGFNLLREEANSLREANANGTEILATTKDELNEAVAKLIYVTRSHINGIDDDKSRELILTLRDIGVHLGAHHENANTIAAWVKQNVPAGGNSSNLPKRSLNAAPKPVPDMYSLVEEDEKE